jgi:hypothetical protein
MESASRPPSGVRTPWVFLKTSFEVRAGQFSPDGRWVAYMSNESGRDEIYIRPFAAPPASGAAPRLRAEQASNTADGQWQVSTAGGIFPRWRADGKELCTIRPDGEMMAVPITATGTRLAPGAPVSLFPARILRRRRGQRRGPAIRRDSRRASSDQHGAARGVRPDHAADELGSRGEEVRAADRRTPQRRFSSTAAVGARYTRAECPG